MTQSENKIGGKKMSVIASISTAPRDWWTRYCTNEWKGMF